MSEFIGFFCGMAMSAYAPMSGLALTLILYDDRRGYNGVKKFRRGLIWGQLICYSAKMANHIMELQNRVNTLESKVSSQESRITTLEDVSLIYVVPVSFTGEVN